MSVFHERRSGDDAGVATVPVFSVPKSRLVIWTSWTWPARTLASTGGRSEGNHGAMLSSYEVGRDLQGPAKPQRDTACAATPSVTLLSVRDSLPFE